jgi:hypothetical protein
VKCTRNPGHKNQNSSTEKIQIKLMSSEKCGQKDCDLENSNLKNPEKKEV